MSKSGESASVGYSGMVRFSQVLAVCLVSCYCGVASAQPCVTNCENRFCGDDGCGGVCGECSPDDVCRDGTCVRFGIEATVSYPMMLMDSKFPLFALPLFKSKLVTGIDLVNVKLTNVSANRTMPVLVRVQIPGLSDAAQKTAMIPPGKTVSIDISPAYDFKALEQIAGQMPSQILLSVLTGEQTVVAETKPMTIVSRNTFFFRDPEEPKADKPSTEIMLSVVEGYPFAYLLTSWITPRDSKGEIDKLIRRAADFMPTGRITGYQEIFGPEESVLEWKNVTELVRREHLSTAGLKVTMAPETHQELVPKSNLAHAKVAIAHLSAIFDALNAMGVTYVNTPQDFFDVAQSIKFPSQSLQTKSANCVEGALVFASALEAMGMRPVVILIPGHAYVGVRAWDDDETIIPIETTMVGKSTASEAIDAAINKFNEYKNIHFIVDVHRYRSAGLMSWPD